MYTLILIGALVGLVFLFDLYTNRGKEYWRKDFEVTAVVGTVGLILAGLLFIVFSYGRASTPVASEHRSNLASLQGKSSVTGNFFLGIGSISEKPAYQYYKDTGGGKFQQRLMIDDMARSRPIYVMEDEEKTPYVLTKEVNSGSFFMDKWRFGTGMGGETNEIQFHVPKGSITRDIQLVKGDE